MALSRPRLVLLLLAVPVVMALLAFVAMPSLYSLWCRVTGTTLRPNEQPMAVLTPTGRFVEVFFESRVFDGLPVLFHAVQPSVQVEVGREAMNTYVLENTSDRELVIRPIHQVSPINAVPHFGMRICFCYEDQVVKPRSRHEFPVAFHFTGELDPRIGTATVCYSLVAIDRNAPASAEQERVRRLIDGQGGVVTPGWEKR
jgi:cytochrome c oxidase assembly protein subunit 11